MEEGVHSNYRSYKIGMSLFAMIELNRVTLNVVSKEDFVFIQNFKTLLINDAMSTNSVFRCFPLLPNFSSLS